MKHYRFFLLGKGLWIYPENGNLGGPGDALYAVLILAPILFFFAGIDFIVFIAILFQYKKTNFKTALVYWFLMVLLWAINMWIFEYNTQGRAGS